MSSSDEESWVEFDAAVRDEASFARARELAAKLPLGRITADGRSTLSSAAMAGADAIAIELLDRGADPFIADETGFSAYEAAAMSGSAAVLRSMLDRGIDPRIHGPALLEAALAGIGRHTVLARKPARAIETIELLLAAGVDPRSKSPKNPHWSLAHCAGRPMLARKMAQPTHVGVLDALLAHGISLDEIFDDARDDALALVASAWTEPVLLEHLVSRGASIAGSDGRGTVLHALAARDAAKEELSSWIDRGARLEARNADQLTPFLLGASVAATRSTLALIELGAVLTAVDASGRNARTLAAARFGSETLVAALEARGLAAQSNAAPPAATGPAPAAIPQGARRARVTTGTFKGFDAWVTARAGGGYDAVVSMFGRGVPATLDASEVTLIDP